MDDAPPPVEPANPYQSPRAIADDRKPWGDPHAVPGVIPTRPTLALTYGILNLVWGALGALFALWAVAAAAMMMVMPFMMPTPPAGSPAPQFLTPLFVGVGSFYAVIAVVSIAIDVMLFLSGVLLLQGRVRGRTWAVRYCWTSLIAQTIPMLLMLLGVVINLVNIAVGGPGPAAQSPVAFGLTMTATGILLLIMYAYPLVQLILLSRRDFADQLAAYDAATFPLT